MRLLILLAMLSFAAARDVREALVLAPVYSPTFSYESLSLSSNVDLLAPARLSLKISKPVFPVDYGDGVLTTRLETLTLKLLEYEWLSNIVTTLSDEFPDLTPRRARIILKVNSRELCFSYSF